MMSFKILQSSNIPLFQNSIVPLSRIAGFLALLCVVGCTTPSSKPPLSVDAQAEALSHFSLGLLAEAAGDSAAALREMEAAIQLDPTAETLYPPAAAIALRLDQPEEALRLARQLNKRKPHELNSLLLLARVTALSGQPAEAEPLFKQAVAAFPENSESILSLARFFLLQNRLSEAIQTLQSALTLPTEQANLYSLLGVLTLESARKEPNPLASRRMVLNGIDRLEKALEVDPARLPLWQQLGYAHLSINQFNKALQALEMARSGMPDDLLLARQVLDLYIQTDAYDRALELFEKLPSQTEPEPEIWLQYLAEKTPPSHRDQLIEYLETHLQQKETPRSFYMQLISLYLDRKSYAEAETTINKALKTDPENARLRTVLGTLLLRRENYAEAYATLHHVRSRSPDTEWVQGPFFSYNFMVAAQKADHFEEAVTTLASSHAHHDVVLKQYMHSLLIGESPISSKAAIDLLESFHPLSPESVEVLYYLSILHAMEEEYEAALEKARCFEVLAQDQGSTHLLTGSFYYHYATLFERTGEIEEAATVFQKAIDLGDPSTSAAAQNYMAYMWAERGENLERGLVMIQKALVNDPNNAAFIDTLGWIYYMQGHYEEALERLQIASELLQNDPTIWEHLGDTYLKLGNEAAATEHWKKASDLTPNEP